MTQINYKIQLEKLILTLTVIYSSLHTFPTDGSPNLSLTSHKSIPPDMEKKHSCNSPMLKTLLEPAPRSRSSDNLEKFSPLVGRRSQGDSPLTASPLARRNTTDSAQTHERSKGEATAKETCYSGVANDASDDSKRSTLTNVSSMSPRGSRDIDDSFASTSEKEQAAALMMSKDQEGRKSVMKKSTTDTEKSSTKLRSTGHDLRSPINGSGSASTKNTSDSAKSPVLKQPVKNTVPTSDGKSNGALLKNKPTPPATAPKPRPWSMATDRKSGKKNFLHYRIVHGNILKIIKLE